jgi:hypothetical protein
MRALPSPLRKQLETAVLAARRAAEGASRAAVDGLGVFADRRPEHLDAEQAGLRNGLRAKWRQLGGDRELLVSECAYEQWHRLLFARFLAENDLLLHPQFKEPVNLADCEDLAGELGEPDGWSVAARFAAEILPGIFRLDDPCVQLRLAPEGRHALEEILDGLPTEVFVADDALGWVYQFWQKDKKDEVNASERKIGGTDLGPVTQLFTENYMVRFLLENSLGAWWTARHPDSPLVKGFEYLRFGDDSNPAAGSFDGWPDRIAEVTVMDPCCGSGHFLVEAFSLLWQMRAEAEELSPIDAQDAVLRDNLFGLELDARCVQIAMFAVALQAWKAGGGWRQLPAPNVACSGVPVKAPVKEWKALARRDARLENALVRLHILFRDADTLGSLIDPKRSTEIADPTGLQTSFEDVDWEELAPLLAQAVSAEDRDIAAGVLGADAVSAARAAELMATTYTLVATNVPYLTNFRQSQRLRSYCESVFRDGKADLAAAMLLRCTDMVSVGGTTATVSPANWFSLAAYRRLREHLLKTHSWQFAVRLGPGAFGTISGEVVKPVLVVMTGEMPRPDRLLQYLDATLSPTPIEKDSFVRTSDLFGVKQSSQLANAASRITGAAADHGDRLEEYVAAVQGLATSDDPQFVRYFWELTAVARGWERLRGATVDTCPYGGCERVLLWEEGAGRYFRHAMALKAVGRLGGWKSGTEARGRNGVIISQVGRLSASLYRGEFFSHDASVLVPKDDAFLPALWQFCQDPRYEREVRTLDQKLYVTSRTLAQVPFDVEYWRKVADEAGALPEPWSDDPTQWLLEGRPEVSTAPLQVAIGRLVGYRWPEQAESDDLGSFTDVDGIVCLPSVAGEAPAADRVQQVLAAAFGEAWSPARVKELLEQAGSKKKNLADWLRDEFFKQHCALFGNRPFVWHVWDGQRGGFSALVNYHRLHRKMLEKLTYSYLGQDWVERQRAEVRDEVAGAEARLSAALELQRKLEAIIDGEKPYDIYVRWKELHEQPVGWEPDLNDGVRLNVRPFVEAGVLRAPFKIHWKKDRGKNPDGSERHNDVHLSLAEKTEARKRAGRA